MTVEGIEDVEGLRVIGRIVADTLQYLMKIAEPGMTTLELDTIAKRCLEQFGAVSAPMKDYKFPGHVCISVNNEAAHGIPSSVRRLAAGDLVNIDVSAALNGYYGDTGGSFVLPPQRPALMSLCKATHEAMLAGVAAARDGEKLTNIAKAIERVARKTGFSVVENLASHGVGRALHEEPREISSVFDPADKRVLKKGMVITCEPFLSTGPTIVIEEADGWTLSVNKKHRTAQFEHTIVVTESEPLIMTMPSAVSPFL